MNESRFSAVDAWFSNHLLPTDAVLESALRESEAAGLPPHQVSSLQGALLFTLARTANANSILEIGTLGGYSTIWLARALAPGGRVVTLEANPHHADVACRNLARAGVDRSVDVLVGPALETLPRVAEMREGAPFDLVFIDADKQSNPEYLAWAVRLSRVGTLIVVDNVVRNGAIIDPESTDPSVRGVQRMCDAIATEPRLAATAIQTVGEKGWDGFVMASVIA